MNCCKKPLILYQGLFFVKKIHNNRIPLNKEMHQLLEF